MKSSKKSSYYPSLFKQKPTKKQLPVYTQPTFQIPNTTLHDTSITNTAPPLHTDRDSLESKPTTTVFGFTPQNKSAVEDLLREIGTFKITESGRNYIRIVFDNEMDTNYLGSGSNSFGENVARLNREVVNGEIIGVYRSLDVLVKRDEIFVERKGWFSGVFRYLFG